MTKGARKKAARSTVRAGRGRGSIGDVSTAAEHPIECAARLTDDEPMLAVDWALRAFGDTRGSRSDSETAHYLDILGSAILRASGVARERGERPMDCVFGETRCDAIATASLLRMLVLDDGLFENQQLRSRTFALFDRQLASRLYARLNLSVKSQTFEKRDALRSATESHETALLSHVESLHSLTAVAAFRQRLFQLFKDQYTQVCMAPFLPPTVNQQLLSELLGATDACVAADDEHLLLEVERATQLLDSAEAEVVAFPTSYCQSLLGVLQGQLRDLLARHVRERGLADPASIKIELRPKSYPLRVEGAAVVLRIDVRNGGPGHATDLELTVEGHQLVVFDQEIVRLGRLQPGSEEVHLRGRVCKGGDSDAILIRLSWRNPDGATNSVEEILELKAQTREVPWERLEYQQAYSLDPVKEASQFAGRKTILRELSKIVLGNEPGNFTIDGQKRVGKTSLAYALRDAVAAVRPEVYGFIFLECGDFNLNTAEDTLARLGTRICEMVKDDTPAARDIEIPNLGQGLAPLTDFFEEVGRRTPERRFVVVLDEFDAMPHPELYDLGRIGSTFFQTLRSLGGKPNLAFGLIGSERMVPVLNAQEQHVNKFRRVQVDYFDDAQREDYALLVREPVKEWLEVDDSAIRQLYQDSAGNPYITKAVGITLFDRAIAARDCDVRVDDVREATTAAIPQLGARAFAHFWDDGISGDPEQQRFVSLTRRRVLLGLAACLRETKPLTEQTLLEAAGRYGVHSADAGEVLRSFRERRILLEAPDGALRCRVPLFARWLAAEGVHDIVVTMGDDDAILRRTRAEEEARIHVSDVEPLATRWRTYRGATINPEGIREWLLQFGNPSDQRLMLKLLNGLRFYNGEDLRAQLRSLHSYVLRDLKESHGYDYTFKGRQQVRNDLVVTALDDGGSGATHLLKPYRDENRIATGLVVPATDVAGAISAAKAPTRALLILEDFIGTGKTAERRLRRLHDLFYDGSVPVDLDVYVLVITGFDEAAARVRAALEKLGWVAHVHVANPLDAADRCFSDSSRIFTDDAERQAARALAVDRGRRLVGSQPLGHEDTEALVAFESRCPNNTLPILWADSDTWTPLFPRH
jgi:hypothetical protein